jgi:protein TonB
MFRSGDQGSTLPRQDTAAERDRTDSAAVLTRLIFPRKTEDRARAAAKTIADTDDGSASEIEPAAEVAEDTIESETVAYADAGRPVPLTPATSEQAAASNTAIVPLEGTAPASIDRSSSWTSFAEAVLPSREAAQPKTETVAQELARKGPEGSGAPAALRSGILRHKDYPIAARKAGAEGAVAVRYTVGIDGKVEDCNIIQSSGNADLDETTCRLVQRRFKYAPARDADGRPTAQVVTKLYEWFLVPKNSSRPSANVAAKKAKS